jgi:hypothetical protein
MNRGDKIKNLKAILAGAKTVADLIDPKDYIWFKGIDDPYLLGNPDAGEVKTEFSEEEYEAYKNSKHPKSKHVLFQETAADPRDEPTD